MNCTHMHKGHEFVVTIDRSTAERGYVLRELNYDRTVLKQHKPLKRDAFEAHFGFSPMWPHESIKHGK
jgi:hypothetical protein